MPVYALGEVEPRVDPTACVHPDAVLIGDVIRPDAVDPARVIAPGVASYLERSRLYRDQLRRID
jgi:carbonic anhydrase/acetyltransferase-like protein (isoleucine patch superfamily)